MTIEKSIIQQAAKGSGISEEDLAVFFAKGEKRVYQPNEWLFQESTPRQWAGIILEGDIELVRGLHGTTRHIATMIAGALISEGTFLEGNSHSNGAFSRNGATIWQISREKIEAFRENEPDLFYRIVARVAVGINRRLRLLSTQIYENKKDVQVMSGFRLEHDSLGQREVSDSVYSGVQTQRAMENFPISGVLVSNFDHLVDGLAMVKKAAAIANHELGVMDEKKMKAICGACDELLSGKLHEHFSVDMFQGGGLELQPI